MFKAQQVTGPTAPGQYSPLQVSGPSAYSPMQTSDTWSDMFAGMMPMIMMVMMFAMITPMLKGVTTKE